MAYDWTQDANAVATYLLDETSGNALDSSNSNDGTLVNSPAQNQAGVFGTSYYFNTDTSDTKYITIPDGSNDFTPASLSVVAWVYNDGSWTGDPGIVSKWIGKLSDTSSVNERSWALIGNSTDPDINLYLKVQVSGDGTSDGDYAAENASPIPEDDWTHVCFAYSPSNWVKLYQDGVLVATSVSAPASLHSSSYPVNIALQYAEYGLSGDASYDWHGKIDEVGIFSDTLDVTDINDIMTNGLKQSVTGFMTCMKGYWG